MVTVVSEEGDFSLDMRQKPQDFHGEEPQEKATHLAQCHVALEGVSDPS